ncbi:MAG TPA: cupin domain-containing protein [Bacteroidetes bacterium]|nr:cupin domain-containing protein [Bacteroidota bacterium]HIL58535.1 cupin domain-containing protein [Rhodothermales bacterium]
MSLDPSTVAPLDRLVPDAPGAVTSGLLLKSPGGSATLFAIAAGEGLGEHATPHEALFTVLGGEAEVVLEGASHTVRAGDAVHFPARARHSVRALSDLRFLLVLLRA